MTDCPRCGLPIKEGQPTYDIGDGPMHSTAGPGCTPTEEYQAEQWRRLERLLLGGGYIRKDHG